MSCDDNQCGTGGWSGPKPGDPDNNITLSANAVRGGIQVSWSYPATNPYAVAHTILYRGTFNDYAKALNIGRIGGSIYYDKLNPERPTEYFYWIQLVSVNGTVMDLIGPVSAIAQPLKNYTMEELTGMIDEGVLAQSLKEHIEQIPVLDAKIIKEILERIGANADVMAAVDALGSDLERTVTLVAQEVTERRDGDSALVDAINLIAAKTAENLAAILEERTVRTTQNEATAKSLLNLSATTAANTAAIQDEKTARTTADSSLAQSISTVQTTLSGNIASVQTSLSTRIEGQDGKIKDIGALYTVKVNINGLAGGFGVYNDGKFVEAGFDVDQFWVGRTSTDKVKPFIISNGIVYIDKARIRNADIDTLKIAGNSVMAGLYAEGGTASIPAYGSVTLISRSIDLGDGNNSGLIVSATVAANAPGNATVGFKVLINGVVCGDQRASMQGGYGYLFPVSGFGYSGSRIATVQLVAYNPADGMNSGSSYNVGASTMAVMGGKR